MPGYLDLARSCCQTTVPLSYIDTPHSTAAPRGTARVGKESAVGVFPSNVFVLDKRAVFDVAGLRQI